ncbi:MAG: hypothetical protein AAB553_01850 [Patescibacteria group bacterium]
MPKKRKTRQQKMQSVDRQKSPVAQAKQDLSPEPYTYSLPQTTVSAIGLKTPSVAQKTASITVSEYAYLGGDLRKTLLLTLAIVICQLLLFFFLPGVYK